MVLIREAVSPSLAVSPLGDNRAPPCATSIWALRSNSLPKPKKPAAAGDENQAQRAFAELREEDEDVEEEGRTPEGSPAPTPRSPPDALRLVGATPLPFSRAAGGLLSPVKPLARINSVFANGNDATAAASSSDAFPLAPAAPEPEPRVCPAAATKATVKDVQCEESESAAVAFAAWWSAPDATLGGLMSLVNLAAEAALPCVTDAGRALASALLPASCDTSAAAPFCHGVLDGAPPPADRGKVGGAA